MKIFSLRNLAALVSVLFSFSSIAIAQQSGSSASVSRSRAITNANPVTASSGYRSYSNETTTLSIPDEVAVEEFVNYHKHRLPMPKAGIGVAMDTRWGNNEISSSRGEAVLQIGFATAEIDERTDLRPLNLSLVIDKSGSMEAADKMSRLKSALATMIGKLRPDDIVSIVVFDSNAKVLFPASRIGNGYEIRRAIDCIEPDGSTNLHAGLMLGYKEALKNYKKGATNRVIMLTDGIANQGVIDPKAIAIESSEYNGQGIDLSAIGVGLELNNDLLRTLAKSGRGLYHFVSDSVDIEKVFVKEVQSLISQVARKVEVSIEPSGNLEIARIYGYSPRMQANGASISLDNMNNGLTQVVMLKMRAKGSGGKEYKAKVRLSYFDVKRNRMIEEIQELKLQPAESKYCDLLIDPEVKKNFTIAELGQSLFDMTEAAKSKRFNEAERLLNSSLSEARTRYPNMEDKDISFILKIIEDYQNNLRAYNRGRTNGDCGGCKN